MNGKEQRCAEPLESGRRARVNLVGATLVRRVHRFGALVHVPDGEWYVHVPSSGRLAELLFPGNEVLVQAARRPGGKTRGRIVFARDRDVWVSIDTQVPTRILGQLLQERRVPPLAAYARVRPEYPYGAGRIDFLLDGDERGLPPCLLEVKSVTLVQDGVALFPDAPTLRGARHLDELARARSEGLRAAVLFLVQRPDARCFRPHDRQDPPFGEALRRAAAQGVEVYAYRCRVDPPRIEVLTDDPVPVDLS